MAVAVTLSRAAAGLAAPEVVVETHLAGGITRFHLVGLPEAAVRESADRVRSAIISSGLEFPSRRITVNLAPADIPKEGGRFDLPIAIGLIAASTALADDALIAHEFYGELSLTGTLRAVRGLLPAVLAARGTGRTLIVPEGNGAEVALVSGVEVRVARHLTEVIAHLAGQAELPAPERARIDPPSSGDDLEDVRGQRRARRALEIAAAGAHSLLLIGPPGTGKTMLAARLPGLLPAMSEDEALEVAAVRSLVPGGSADIAWRRRPFRAPHHTASGVALVGGGGVPRPGEVSLAHNGVLFLDELPEFSRRVLEVLREPLESGRILISRAARQAQFPARFQLVAAMNPCPCGYAGDSSGRCHCSADQISRYRDRISGPLLDRLDMHIEVPRVPPAKLLGPTVPAESTATVRRRVERARALAESRQGCSNAVLNAKATDADLEPAARALLEQAMSRLDLSARAAHRVLRVARTIADLAEAEAVGATHVAEALSTRCLGRK